MAGGDYPYWNPAGGNKENYYGTGGSGYLYVGLVGGAVANDDGSRWKLIDAPVLPPVISFDNVTNQVTITCETEGAVIRYTTDGTDPDPSTSPTVQTYTGPFVQNDACTIKAVAVKETNTSSVYTFNLEQVAPPPVIQVEENNTIITISTTTEGATIHFTCDNSIPTAVSPVYTVPLDYQYSGLHIKAIAVKTGMLNSAAASPVPDPIILKCPQPEIYPDFETNLVYLFCDADAASIYYTLNGDPPTSSSTLYDGTPFPLPSTGTVNAIATLTNCNNSDVVTYTIAVAATPDVHLNEGHNNIAITTTTVGADIYYTIDGSNPTTRSIRYTGPFREGPNHERVSNVEIKAIAVKSGMFWSNIGSRTVMLTCEPPLINRIGNNSFSISSVFPETNVSIYYTLNGDAPTLSSTLYSGPFSYSGSLPFTIKAIAVADNYDESEIAAVTYSSTNDLEGEGTDSNPYLIRNDYDYTLFVAKANTPAGSSKHYKLVANINAAGTSEVTTTFTGIFEGSADADGNFYTISNLDHPMFTLIDAGVTNGPVTTRGIVRNVILKDVAIVNHAGNTGAIACEIKGGALIYNCGILNGSVGGTGDTGGLVGWLHAVPYNGYNNEYQYPNGIYGFTRVVNCFSFANITSAGTYAAGIVGNNDKGSNTQNHPNMNSNLRSAVVNCMFYGDIFEGTNKYPVYGNMDLVNANNGINNYDYCLESATFHNDFEEADRYHHSWPAKEEYLTRFEYYRSILNCNRNLCAFYVSGKPYSDASNAAARDEIAKWVLDPSIAKYPILKQWKKYPSIINQDPNQVWNTASEQWVNRTNALGYQGKSYGTLTVTVKTGDHPGDEGMTGIEVINDKSWPLTITDMDTLNHDYCYYKVQLPYYNEVFGQPTETDHIKRYYGNYTDKVVTGWKITAVIGGIAGNFKGYASPNGSYTPNTISETAWEDGFNFADRNCTNKDVYSVSGRVFAQGGYYYVPEGVTAITIEAYWGRAVYVHNTGHSVDRVNLGESAFTPAGTYDGAFNGQTVYTGIPSAIEQLTVEGSGASTVTVYDQAIVLVGNVQLKNSDTQTTLGWHIAAENEEWATNNRPYTLTSVDLDFDNEPDYCFQLQLGKGTQRVNIHPVRFDFLAMPSLGMAIRKDQFLYAIGIFIPRGHFEVTETAFMHTGQFEYDTHNTYRKKESPLILNGGEYEQFVSAQSWKGSVSSINRTNYIIVGGHVWMKEFTPGKHVRLSCATRHCAVSVMGGEYGRLCLSGGFYSNGQAENKADNPHCYTNGGKFGTMSGAGMENIKGSVTFEIDHSLIKEFYGGGLNAAKPISGSINVTINNSIVGKYCGGPFTGDMNANTQVTTNAFNTVFGYFYGGGNGGTNFNRDNMFHCDWTVTKELITEVNWRSTDETGSSGTPTPHKGSFDAFSPLSYVSDNYGYQARFEFELIDMSSGLIPSSDNPVCAVMRTYVHEAQFTATQVQKVVSTLTNCTVLHDFYGGGNLGKVAGDVTSTLDGTTVLGAAYGGGNDSDVPTFSIHNGPTVSDSLFFPYRDGGSVNHPGYIGFQKDDGVIRKYKWINIDDPLAVQYGADPTDFNGKTFCHEGEYYCVTKKDMSDLGAVHGSTFLNINGNTKIYGSRKEEDEYGNQVTFYDGAAFGGGNKSTVFGNSTVTIDGSQGVLVSNVYGGGNIAITGDTINNRGGNSTVIIRRGTIGVANPANNGMPYEGSGRVYGAGKGSLDGRQLGLVRRNATIVMKGGRVLSCLYGGGEMSNVGMTRNEEVEVKDEQGNVLHTWNVAFPIDSLGVAMITMTGGVVGLKRDSAQIYNSHEMSNVFGGGRGDARPAYNTWTNVNKSIVNIVGGRVWGSVFGGGEEGHVLGDIDVTINMPEHDTIGTSGHTTYDGNVFGGGRGHDAQAVTAAGVGGNVVVRVLGGHILGSVFGGGRNGSVGTYLVPRSYTGLYGELQPGDGHGFIHVYVGGTGQSDDVTIGHPANGDDRVGGNVYGGGKGIVFDPDVVDHAEKYARVKETHVLIAEVTGKQTFVEGSVFGSGEDGHVSGDTYVMVSGGQIGGEDYNPSAPTLCDDVFHGNVYGGGRGLDQYVDVDADGDTIIVNGHPVMKYSESAGKVYGNTNVTITGGRVCRNVFGGGNLASVGVAENPYSGITKVIITGGTIGVNANSANRNGLVFGAGKGRAGATYERLSFVKNTQVYITGTARVMGTVYGSGDDGHVREHTRVVVGNATVDADWNGEDETYSGGSVIIGTRGVAGVDGNIYGAGRGADKDDNGNLSPTAGVVGVSISIEVNNGTVMGSVYGGGRTSSVGYEDALAEEHKTPYDYSDFGRTNIVIGRDGDSSGENDHATIGTEGGENGYVFGAGKGDAGQEFREFTWVHETKVEIKGHAVVRGAVFGGGEDGHVKEFDWVNPDDSEQVVHKDGDTHVLISGDCIIGEEGATGRKGNVYGGGRGIDQYIDENGVLHYSPTAGRVAGSTHVTITGGDVLQNVYGGGNKSSVGGHKTVNITDGWVHKNVYGGSNEIPFDPTWSHAGLKTVNMMGGKAHKLFGCSHNTIDGDFNMYYVVDEEHRYLVYMVVDDEGNHRLYYNDGEVHECTDEVDDLIIEAKNANPTSFVNISGGYLYDTGEEVGEHEQGSIHGAGLAGVVYGSVMVNIGANAVLHAPYHEFNVDVNDVKNELHYFTGTAIGEIEEGHNVSKMQVSCSVFGGADYYQSENNPGDWNHFNVKGYSNIYIDGQGYNMTTEIAPNTPFNNLPTNCMVLDGNIYGSGTHCESGELGRNIIVRNYGVRVNSTASGQTDWFDHSTRPMGTIQRCGNLVIDNSNFTFTGMPQLGHDDGRLYSVMKIDSCLYMANSSALTLGSGDVPAHMDSIRRLQSAYLIDQSSSNNVFSQKFVEKLDWGWIGLKAPTGDDNADDLYYMNSEGTAPVNLTPLTKAQENIIIFNGPTKLWVRYHDKKSGDTQYKQYYGELKGFFRMLSPYRPKGIESFAYARPKIMDNLLHSTDHYNMADGGFLSYNTSYNDFLGGGYNSYQNYTNTKQYPYTNVISILTKAEHSDLDVQDYRMWVMASPFDGNCWYVDGTRNLGVDDRDPGRGLYPDKPKLSVSGTNGVYSGTRNKADTQDVVFDYDGARVEGHTESDIIFVVGAIKDVYELAEGLVNQHSDYELKLYRYPGGHELYSNGKLDGGPDYSGSDPNYASGPGPNYGAMLDVGGGTGHKAITLDNVYMDGLYGHTSIDRTYLKFKETDFTQVNVDKPMIVTSDDASLTLKGTLTTDAQGKNPTTGTIVTRGYNNTDASAEGNYYVNSDVTAIINGGGLYVDEGATVNVEGLVTLFENKQKNGSDAIPSNVFLPAFNTHLQISGNLSEATRIGITSPVKNTASTYKANTFSPVAVGVRTGTTGTEDNATIDARNAWLNNNFHDDLHWFFGRGFNTENGSHTAYYNSTIPDYSGGCTTERTVFFGWTWNNVVRSEPAGYVDDGEGNITITSKEGLAWLISQVNGLNGQTKTDFAGTTIKVTDEIDGLDKYIWVPAGSEKVSTANFAGTFDGKGHLIKGITIRYIGIGDSRYEYNNYGMFGKTNGATINRTFLIDEHIEPNSKGNMGGLIGMMHGDGSLVSNSETAVEITCASDYQSDENACGGLVGYLIDGEIHSSMSMPDITASRGYVGGLVGTSSDPESSLHDGVRLRNSFTNAQFTVSANVLAGGLMGNNILSTIENCYSNLTHTGTGAVAALVHTSTGAINKCYGKEGYPLNLNFGNNITNCATYSAVTDADHLGYMYCDNLIEGDTTLAARLNMNAWDLNPSDADTVYSHWARPTLAEINNDLPVLLLGEFDAPTDYQGKFRSVGTYSGGPALQYGGPVRDGDGNQLDGALARLSASDALFIYGDITTAPTTNIEKDAIISIFEDAAIVTPGTLSSYDSVYVGVTFDNSSRSALDFYGNTLPRDWHMLSSPLSDAPLGVNYNGDEKQYGFQAPDLPQYAFYEATTQDGYFPYSTPYNKYDYFCWYEPAWQWINFKRNGPSHWHFDVNPNNNNAHEAIVYHYDNDAGTPSTSPANVNEPELVPGKGYMMAIDVDTYMQSHGQLNNSSVTIKVTAEANTYGEQYNGHNLIGNPYHAYLNFDELVKLTSFSDKGINSFYLYDADSVGYLIYPSGGSIGGAYPSSFLHPHQAFFVKTSKTGDVTFDPASILTTRKPVTFRGEQPAYPLVNLYAVDAEGRKDILVVEFERPENGGGFKAKALRNGKHQLYARFQGEDYGAFFAEKGTQRVTVCFKTDVDMPTPYTLRWNLKNGEFHTMRLIDNITGVDYDMLANDSYSFEGSKYDYATRFYIVFSCTGIDEDEPEPEDEVEGEGNFAFFDGTQWVVNGSGQLQLVDLTGRVLQTERLSSEQSHVSFNRYASGMYLLRLYGNKSTKVQKIVIMQ